MWQMLSSLLDILLPRKERVVRAEQYSLEDLHITPEEHIACGTRITTLMSYKTQAVDDLIRALKYDRAPRAAALLADALAEYVREEIASLKSFSPMPIVLVPVPLHTSRVRERGFNQMEVVLKALPKEFLDGTLARIETTALVRTRDTAQQTRLSRSERLTNVSGAFQLIDPEALEHAHVIIIDDVTTTGATLSQAALPLQAHKILYSLLALARA